MPYPYEAANAYDSGSGKTNIEQKNTGAYLSTVGATLLKVGGGYFDVASGVPGTGAVQFYDVSSATTASLATLSQIGVFPGYPTTINGATTNTQSPVSLSLHAQLNNGLYVNIVSTATVANVTVSYN